MADRYDPLTTESIPDEPPGEEQAVPPDVRRTQGRGELYAGTNRVAKVRYDAALIEESRPTTEVPGPLLTGHGIFTVLEEEQPWDPGSNMLALHLEDGRSVPLVIDSQEPEGVCHFQIRRD